MNLVAVGQTVELAVVGKLTGGVAVTAVRQAVVLQGVNTGQKLTGILRIGKDGVDGHRTAGALLNE